MEQDLHQFFLDVWWPLLAASIAVCILVLGKGADVLVSEAVILSERLSIPKVVIGATIVSLGTTAPEAVISVLSAYQGEPGIALGNAVGSVICDTGLILGVACLIAPPPLDRSIVNRQGWIQYASGWLLVLACVTWSSPFAVFQDGGRLPRLVGLVFLLLLAWYIGWTVYGAMRGRTKSVDLEELEDDKKLSTGLVVVKLVVGLAAVVGSSWMLIPAVTAASYRLEVPEGVVAATIVAFGTSLPELVTAVTASLKGHGDLAVGNIVGADILNVLFVSGAAAVVTQDGLEAPTEFFWIYFPCMLAVLTVFRIGIFFCGDRLGRGFGVVLILMYLISTVVGFVAKDHF
jgi:cation:H+ antiporter